MNPSEDPRVVYADIIDHPHHQSPTRPHMSLYDRAAQFAAFDALAGFSDMIVEEARTVDTAIVLDENAISQLDQKLSLIVESIENGEQPCVTFTIFVPDHSKIGGAYIDVRDIVKRIDVVEQKVILESKNELTGIHKSINIKDVVAIRGDVIDKENLEAVPDDN